MGEYRRWKTLGASPIALGLASADTLDPRWTEAMMLIEGELNRQRAAARPRSKK